MVRQPCKHIGEPGARVDIIELATLNQRIDRCGPTAAGVGAGEGPVAAADGNLPFILPVLRPKSRFIIAGTRCTAGEFGCITVRYALAPR
jgi:hypothetical protein